MRLIKPLLVTVVILFAAAAYSQNILAENFRNTDCGNCRPQDDAFEGYLKKHLEFKVVVVNIHTSFPFPGDPFYLAAKADVNSRAGSSFYNIPSNPRMYIDGYDGLSAASGWETRVENAPSLPATLEVTKSMDVDSLITVKIRIGGLSDGKQVRPFVYFLESGIYYVNSKLYGTMPDNLWNNILRAVATTGDPFIITGTKDIEITYNAKGKKWDMTKVSAVVFLQDVEATPAGSTNYPIYGLTETPKGFQTGVICGGGCSGSTTINPVYNINDNSTSLKITIAKPANVKITLSDMLGIDAATVYDGFANANTFTAEIPTNILPAGMYFARMFVGGTLVDVKKIIVNR